MYNKNRNIMNDADVIPTYNTIPITQGVGVYFIG